LIIVLDASVVLKWLFNDPGSEPLTREATELVEIAIDRHQVLQPVHWLAEVAAVLARKTPETAQQSIELLDALGWKTVNTLDVMSRACRLSIELDHHLFDTLYHALALDRGALLVTGDQRYLTKAQSIGQVCALDAWRERLTAAEND